MRKPENYDTGEILDDLPSPYLADPVFGLLHMPRFLAKARKHLSGNLPKAYQRNFCKGFDGFLCMHLGIDPETILKAIENCEDEDPLYAHLKELFPSDVKAHVWNRELVQKGMSEMGRESLAATKKKMGIEHRTDLISFADMIDFDEDRIE